MDLPKNIENFTIQVIDDLITNKVKESKYLDYKSDIINNVKLAKMVSCFANTDGGYIIFGIATDNDDIPIAKTPIENTPKRKEQFSRTLRDSVFPPINNLEIKTISTDNNTKCFLIIQIPRTEHAHYIISKNRTKYYRRMQFECKDVDFHEILYYKKIMTDTGKVKAYSSTIKEENKEDSPKLYRQKIRFFNSIKQGGIYRDRDQYWYNPHRIYDNHHVATFIGNLITEQQYEELEPLIGDRAKNAWFHKIETFMKHQHIVLDNNHALNDVLHEKAIFNVIKGENYDSITLKEFNGSEKGQELVKQYLINANKCLVLYSEICAMPII